MNMLFMELYFKMMKILTIIMMSSDNYLQVSCINYLQLTILYSVGVTGFFFLLSVVLLANFLIIKRESLITELVKC